MRFFRRVRQGERRLPELKRGISARKQRVSAFDPIYKEPELGFSVALPALNAIPSLSLSS